MEVMKVEKINTVCFIGAGTMGCFNSLLAALAGYQAILFDVSAASFDHVEKNFTEMADFLVMSGFCCREDIDEALSRISKELDLKQATANADLVSESVFERLDVKRDLHKQLDAICPPHCILTTNTSALMVSDIEDVVERGDKFAALHSHLGATLFDIVAGPRTTPDTTRLLNDYVVSLNCTPLILKKEHPGYVLNAMLGPVLTMSMMLVIEGAATIEEIDRSWMQSRGAPMGPFGMMDLFGLNVVIDSWQQPKPNPEMEKIKGKIISFIGPYIERNELGMKSGKGFYHYPDPTYANTDFLTADKIRPDMDNILVTTLIENAVLIASREVVSKQDIDRAWTVGTRLQQGPFAIVDEMGKENFISLYTGLASVGLFTEKNVAVVTAYLTSY